MVYLIYNSYFEILLYKTSTRKILYGILMAIYDQWAICNYMHQNVMIQRTN